jgi:hypothetical protein
MQLTSLCLCFVTMQCKKLGFPIEFIYIITLNLIILRKYNIVCVSLIDAVMCLNSIKKPDILYLRIYT